MTLALILALLQDPSKPWKMEDAVSLAKTALKEKSEVKDWRPALKEHLNGFLDRIGKDGSTDSLRFVYKAFEEGFAERNTVLREIPDTLERSIGLASKAKGRDGKEFLLVCESGEFEDLRDGVVVCTGDLKARKLRKCLILAAGKFRADECEDCIVFSGGDMTLTRRAKHATLLVLGTLKSAEAEDVVFLNPGERKIEKSNDTKDVEKPNLPKKK